MRGELPALFPDWLLAIYGFAERTPSGVLVAIASHVRVKVLGCQLVPSAVGP
jgi:hypothetical protein